MAHGTPKRVKRVGATLPSWAGAEDACRHEIPSLAEDGVGVMLKRIRRVVIGALASGLLMVGLAAVSATVGVRPAGALVVNAPIVGIASTADGGGYWMVGRDGGVFTFGDAPFSGSVGGAASAPIVGMAVDPQTGGYRMATSSGGLWWFDSSSYGWVTGQLNAPVVGIATDPATDGYWMVASDGGVFAFNAPFLGSMGGTRLNQPIVGMAATSDGNGYWLVAKDGGVFAFGDASFYGSMGGTRLNQPVVGMAADSQSGGYWLVARDGGIFAFNAPFDGSTGGIRLNAPVVGMAATPDDGGYWMVGSDGGVFAFGDAPFLGSVPGIAPPLPTTFSDGTFLVGRNIAAGTYKTSGGPDCYWARLSGLSGSLSDIIANDLPQGQSIVTISPNDVAFTSDGCGTWVPAPTVGPQATSFGDGTFAVGIDIAPGTYITPGGVNCYWARLSGFGGTLGEIITNDLPQGQAIVSIDPTDKGFTSDGCGTWTRQ